MSKRNGPRAALTLGRAISLPDFEALARGVSGCHQCGGRLGMGPGYQRAAVRVWVVSDGGSVAGDVAASLRAQSDPHVPLSVAEATRFPPRSSSTSRSIRARRPTLSARPFALR